MESPDGWDHLTACVAVVDLAEPAHAFAFLVSAGVVRNDPGAAPRFAAIVAKRSAEPPVTGPSLAARIAVDLSDLRGTAATWPVISSLREAPGRPPPGGSRPIAAAPGAPEEWSRCSIPR